MWMYARRAILLGFGCLLAHAGSGQAAPTRHLRVTTYKDFAEGEVHGVLLSSRGELLSGQAATRLPLPSLGDDSVRALAAAPDGVVYVGTGGDGPTIQVYEKGGLRKLAKLETSTWVTALCVLPIGTARGNGGELLAATAHDGRIFQVGRDGKVKVHARVEADHIWAMVHDRRRSETYVATGPGRLWAVDGKSPPRRIFDSGAKQILALTQGDDGALYIGTADDAVLYRVDPARPGSVRTLHDFAGTELRALAYGNGALYAAVNDMARSESSANRPGVRIVTPPAGTAPGTGKVGAASTERQGKGALYRIEPDGRIEQMHAISDGFFNDLQVDAGGIFAGVSTPGGRGRVYWIQPDRTVLTALELKESDVLALGFTGGAGGRLVGTGNSGALYRLGPMNEPPKDAHYLSKVFDAQVLARWGGMRYAGSGPLNIQTRSGNLAKPDGTWSAWQPLHPSRLPTEEWGGKIASPMGRYLQVRVGFGQRALLHDFTLSYQATNQRPRVTEFQVGEDPLGRIARGPKGTAAKPRQPLVKLHWKVENPDEDELVHRLYIRTPGGGSEWQRVGGQEPLTRTELEWNTESVPDGIYEIKVITSDERANPAGQALSHELISAPFIVDNRRPELKDLAYDPATGMLRGRAVDAVSPLAELAYALDGGDFLPLAPRDGVLDDNAEDFALKLPPLGPGLHVIVVRAADAAENATAARLKVQSR